MVKTSLISVSQLLLHLVSVLLRDEKRCLIFTPWNSWY